MSPRGPQRLDGAADDAPLVATGSGLLRGCRPAPGLCAFLGIPYAQPPVGDLRFREPRAVEAWEGIRDASRFGPASAQFFDPHEALIEEIEDQPTQPSPAYVGSEDCLTLNIWTPQPDAAKRPVIVYLHGGANWLESSRLRIYHGERFVQRGDVVFCSLNYRLGIFGFLDLAEGGLPSAHCNGLRDQLLALQWIRSNVPAFGGDPDNITLIGESAGSMDISWLLASGELDGLIRRAVLMSGVAGVPGLAQTETAHYYSEDMARERTRELLRLLRLDRVQELLTLDTATLMTRLAQAVPQRHMLFFWDSLFYPRLDHAFLPRTPFAHVAEGRCRGIDLMIGSTGYETGLWLLWDQQLDQRDTAWMSHELQLMPDAQRADAAALYDRLFAHEPAGVRGMQLISDAMFVMPGVALAELQVATGGNAWLYQFRWEVPDSPLRATHAADLFFCFDHLDLPAARQLIGSTDDPLMAARRQALAERMQDALIRFAREGDPGWPLYDARARAVQVFDLEDAVLGDPFHERRRWWMEQVYASVLRRPA